MDFKEFLLSKEQKGVERVIEKAENNYSKEEAVK